MPLYTWVLDLWPESLSAAGGVHNKYVLGFFDRFVKKEYEWSDRILISSRSFENRILKYGDYKARIFYYPQWSDGKGNIASTISTATLPIPEGFIIMFAGAIGEVHGFECIMKAALLTKEHKEIKWVIVGDGRKLEIPETELQRYLEMPNPLKKYKSNARAFKIGIKLFQKLGLDHRIRK